MGSQKLCGLILRNQQSHSSVPRSRHRILNVPVKIVGKLRPQHLVLQDRVEDLLLLSVTWMDAYNAKIHPRRRLLELLSPVKA